MMGFTVWQKEFYKWVFSPKETKLLKWDSKFARKMLQQLLKPHPIWFINSETQIDALKERIWSKHNMQYLTDKKKKRSRSHPHIQEE